MSLDDVYQVRIEHRSRALGDGFLVDPRFVVTAAEAVREAGPELRLRAPGVSGTNGTHIVSGAGAEGTKDDRQTNRTGSSDDTHAAEGSGTVAAEVIEVLGAEGLALLAVAEPGFRATPAPAGPTATLERPGHDPIPARDLGGWLLRFRRLGAGRLRADLDGTLAAEAHPHGANAPGASPAASAGDRGHGTDAARTTPISTGAAGGYGSGTDTTRTTPTTTGANGSPAGDHEAGTDDARTTPTTTGANGSPARDHEAGTDDARTTPTTTGAHHSSATDHEAGADERGALLLDHLRRQARSGRLEPVVTVPAWGAGEGSR